MLDFGPVSRQPAQGVVSKKPFTGRLLPIAVAGLLLLAFAPAALAQPKPILIQPQIRFQRIDGFGVSGSNGSAREIHNLPSAERLRLFDLLFSSKGSGPEHPEKRNRVDRTANPHYRSLETDRPDLFVRRRRERKCTILAAATGQEASGCAVKQLSLDSPARLEEQSGAGWLGVAPGSTLPGPG